MYSPPKNLYKYNLFNYPILESFSKVDHSLRENKINTLTNYIDLPINIVKKSFFSNDIDEFNDKNKEIILNTKQNMIDLIKYYPLDLINLFIIPNKFNIIDRIVQLDAKNASDYINLPDYFFMDIIKSVIYYQEILNITQIQHLFNLCYRIINIFRTNFIKENILTYIFVDILYEIYIYILASSINNSSIYKKNVFNEFLNLIYIPIIKIASDIHPSFIELFKKVHSNQTTSQMLFERVKYDGLLAGISKCNDCFIKMGNIHDEYFSKITSLQIKQKNTGGFKNKKIVKRDSKKRELVKRDSKKRELVKRDSKKRELVKRDSKKSTSVKRNYKKLDSKKRN